MVPREKLIWLAGGAINEPQSTATASVKVHDKTYYIRMHTKYYLFLN